MAVVWRRTCGVTRLVARTCQLASAAGVLSGLQLIELGLAYETEVTETE